MTSVKVAVRVRPRNKREDASATIIEMEGKQTRITNPKVPDLTELGDHGRDDLKLREFSFDHSFWSANSSDPHFVTQEQVFEAVGPDVLAAVYEGYNVCVFAYGQTSSGKTFTMMGTEENPGFVPRFCQGVFSRMNDPDSTYRTQVSYLEIYNEKVRDLLSSKRTNGKPAHKLRIREHPKDGPYVQDLSQHTVVSYDGIAQLMNKGNTNRVTASTMMNDVSSRSHAIFTITFTQAKFQDGLPSERQSKINLVDLAGSERADTSGATGQRLKEGGSINRSLVTLGNVISVLAEAAEGKACRRQSLFIPYRDSQLTWLLKDSLGGNAKTIMIATISPSELNYGETLSTLRYASRAKSIINRPTVNEDANVRLIRELRQEIARLRALLGSNMKNVTSPRVHEMLHENEARIKVLTEEWTDKWKESASILQEVKTLELRKEGAGVILDSSLPHLIRVDDDVLSTGITLYHLKEGLTKIGTEQSDETQDIVICGESVEPEHCVIEYRDGVVTLHPIDPGICLVNGTVITDPIVLNQGAVIQLGQTNTFRFNYPAEAQKLKQIRKSLSTLSLSKSPALDQSRTSLLSHSMNELYRSNDSLMSSPGMEFEELRLGEQEHLDVRRQEIKEMEELYREQERQWLSRQHHLEEQLEVKEQELFVLQNQLSVIQQTMSPCQSVEEALRRLEQQEQAHLEETQKMKEELLQELQELSVNHQATKSSVELALTELDHQTATRQAQITILQQESDLRRQALHTELQKEEAAAERLENEMSAILEEMNTEKERLLGQNGQLKTAYTQLSQLEVALRVQQEQLDMEKNSGWQAVLNGLKEEMDHMEMAWQALKEQECLVDSKLAEDSFDSDKERRDYQNKREHNRRTRRLMESNEARLSAAHTKEMERVKVEMDRWTRQKESELAAVEKKRADFLRRQSRVMSSLWKKLEAKQSEVKNQQERQHHADSVLKLLDSQVQSQIQELREEQGMLLDLKERKSLEQIHTAQETQEKEEEINCRLKDIQQSSDVELKRIQDEKQRLLDLRKRMEEDPSNEEEPADYMDSAAVEILQERQKQLDEKTQECQELQQRVKGLQRELDTHHQQQEEDRELELDNIHFKKLQLEELERQERINALVEQEVKRRLFEEKVQRERLRRTERERDRLERELEIQKLKSGHEKEMRLLQAGLCNSNGISHSQPYGLEGVPDSSTESRKKLVKQLSSVGPPPPLEITIPDFALHGSGFETHYEFEVKIKIGAETWHLFRRYSRFRELHQSMKKEFPNVNFLVFPPRRIFYRTQRVAAERRVILEQYLKDLVELCQRDKSCVLHPDNNQYLTKRVLAEFHPFFRRGLFEHPKHVAS